jgi:hypothetical protein
MVWFRQVLLMVWFVQFYSWFGLYSFTHGLVCTVLLMVWFRQVLLMVWFLTAFNNLEIMSEIVLPLQDTDRFNQLKIMSEGYMGNKISVNILISLFLNLVDPIDRGRTTSGIISNLLKAVRFW